MNVATFNADISYSSSIASVEFNMATTSLTVDMPVLIQSSTDFSIESGGEFSNNGYSASESLSSDGWNGEKGARFNDLALKESVADISIVELAELEQLTRLRRTAKYSRPADEILWERKQKKHTDNLIRAIAAYVEFHETTHTA